MSKSLQRTRNLVLMAMLAAMAYVLMAVGRVPVIMFLKYDPKDVVLGIGGFMLGPGAAALMSLLVSLIEMVTVSETGFIGFFMNVLSTCAFICPAAWFYHRKRSLRSATIGLAVGVILMTIMMLAWNYIITPIYMGYPRAAVAEMLLPVFLPFNLIKGALNAAFTILLYKPISSALLRSRLVSGEEPKPDSVRKIRWPVTIAAIAVAVTCALLFYLLGHH